MTVLRLSLTSVVPVIVPFLSWKTPVHTDLFFGVNVHWAVRVPSEAPAASLSGVVKTKPSPGEGLLPFARGGMSTNLKDAPLPVSTSLKVRSPLGCWAEPAPGSRTIAVAAAAAAEMDSAATRFMRDLRRSGDEGA